jgi:branched-chain amino acid transport system substrate-binding protein
MKKMRILVVAVAALVLGLTSTALGAEPIKIGAFFDLSGPASSVGTPTKLVAEMVVDRINAQGGVDGRPLELVTGDTEGDPTKAIAIVKKFINVDKVAAIIGPTRTDTGMAVKKMIEAAGIPTIMTVGGDPVIMEGKVGKMNFGTAHWIFKSPQRSSTAVAKTLGYMRDNGITKVALLTSSDGFGRDGKRWMRKLAPEYGVEIVADESFDPKDADMTAQLTKIKAAGPDAIVCWTVGPGGAIVAKNRQQLGIETPLFQCHGLPDPKYIELAGREAAEGNLMPSTKLMAYDQLSDDDPQKAVIEEFVRLYNEEYNYDEQFPINTHSGYAWDAIMIAADAMEKAGTDPDKLRDAIVRTDGYVGISGVYHISEEDHNGLDTDSMIMVRIEDGDWILVE